jgi:hypothetical protein
MSIRKGETVPKKKMAQRRATASGSDSRYIPLTVSRSQFRAYRVAAAKGFNGNLSNFLRAAADALAADIEQRPEPDRTDFWREVARALRGKPPKE